MPGTPRHLTEGEVELDGAVLEAAGPQPGGTFTQHGGVPAIGGSDAPLGGADGPRGGVERLLGARGGGERRGGHGEQRAEAREAGLLDVTNTNHAYPSRRTVTGSSRAVLQC
jgi:hypothetical protein